MGPECKIKPTNAPGQPDGKEPRETPEEKEKNQNKDTK
jgi:hypothetical protein